MEPEQNKTIWNYPWQCGENRSDDLVIEENTIYEIDQSCFECLCRERWNKNKDHSEISKQDELINSFTGHK